MGQDASKQGDLNQSLNREFDLLSFTVVLFVKGQLFNVLWFEAGAGNDVVEQTEEKKLQCVVKKLSDSPEINTMVSL